MTEQPKHVRFKVLYADMTTAVIDAPHILAAICEGERAGQKPVVSCTFIGGGAAPPLPAIYTHPAGPL